MRTTFGSGAVLAIGLMLGLVAGCGEKKVSKDTKRGTGTPKEEDHHHEGPHGGHVIELGNGAYHAELTHDDATKSVAIYLFDETLKKPVTSDEKEITINITAGGETQEYKLTAAPLESDPPGKASRFELKDEKLVDAWDAPNNKGRLRVNIGGKSFTGEIEPHEHDDHDKK
jgi:hypothetical protein